MSKKAKSEFRVTLKDNDALRVRYRAEQHYQSAADYIREAVAEKLEREKKKFRANEIAALLEDIAETHTVKTVASWLRTFQKHGLTA